MGEGNTSFEELLKLLPEGWQEKAKELGALQRSRYIKSAGELLRLILVYLTSGKSFAGTSAVINLGEEKPISKVAVFKRFVKSAEWLQWLCKNIYRHEGLISEKPKWLKDRNICLVDSSEDVICGTRRQCFLLHYCLDANTLSPREMDVTDIRSGEKVSRFSNLNENDIVIGDRIYGTIPGIIYLKEHGCDFVLRLRGHAFNLYNKKGQKTNVINRLKGLKSGQKKGFSAWYKHDGRLCPIRICAMRKDRESERKGLKRLVKGNQRKRGGKEVSDLQKDYNKYIIVATSLKTDISAGRVLELYRMRWQIEVAFKRLKSQFQYNDIPTRIDKNAYAWFYGKLLLAALCETVVNTARFSP